MCRLQQKIVFSQVGNEIVGMKRRISFRAYTRRFVRPLATARGKWVLRQGFIIRVEQDGHVGYGEVAPLPEFGTETVEAAAGFLKLLEADPATEVPDELPCCAFGLSVASSACRDFAEVNCEIAALLPAGRLALDVAAGKLEAGYRVLKWKIGVGPVEEESKVCLDLLESTRAGVQFRLDANGGLGAHQLEKWMDVLRPYADRIEFIEQPLPVGQEQKMRKLSSESGIALALDESLNGPAGCQWFEPGAWDGPLVIKPLLMGDFDALLKRLRPCASRLVLSSVFETDVGLGNALALKAALPKSQHPLGFDTRSVFRDDLSMSEGGPFICGRPGSAFDPEEIWNRLPYSI
jgi:O-succinylbenzoate synthase